jgi:glyoxylase-like metal-dependent hydrolase (beta-lactamase superfamily II)
LGDFEVTALNDGVVPYPTAQLLPTATPEQVEIALADCALKDPVGMSYNAFLINTGSKLVLIDTGTGGKLDDQPAFHGAGHLMANLRAAGYQPEQIDEIYITHLGRRLLGGRWTPDVSRNRPHPNGPAALLLDPGELLAAVIA